MRRLKRLCRELARRLRLWRDQRNRTRKDLRQLKERTQRCRELVARGVLPEEARAEAGLKLTAKERAGAMSLEDVQSWLTGRLKDRH